MSTINRRRFLSNSASGLAAGIGAVVSSTAAPALGQSPAVHTSDKSGRRKLIGEGDYQYEMSHNYFKLPSDFHWQTTHNVAVDKENNVYVIHEGVEKLKDHPAIFVFDAEGIYIKSFGQEFQGGGHGLEVNQEGNEEFLYVTTSNGDRRFAKLTTDGETLWVKRAPMETGLYRENDNTVNTYVWGERDTYKPTNTAFLDDGGFLVADGYGAYVIHRHDKDGNYVSTIGDVGRKDGEFLLPHGLWIDNRKDEKRIVVADRSNNRVQYLDIEGNHLKTVNDYLMPANVDLYENILMIPELHARITLLDEEDNIVARLGDDAEYRKTLLANNREMRSKPDMWQDGRFIHPHDACFDKAGDIIVAEWVATGRITKLTRV